MRLEQRLYRVGGGHGFKQATENILNKDKKEVGKSLVEKIKTLLKNKKKEKVYSEAFQDGVNYAIEKMFTDPLFYDIAEKGAKDAEAAVEAAKTSKANKKKENLLKRIWKSKLGKASVVTTGAAGLGYGGYKLYKNRKDKQE